MFMTTIAASELILNERGAIYHLNLRPEELAPTVITVGDPDRVKSVSKHFDRLEGTWQHREFVTHTGYIGSKRISVVSTGIGTDNVDIVLNELDALANIDFNSRMVKEDPVSLRILRLGTAGALQEQIPVDSIVVSSHGLGLDNLLHFYHWQNTPEELQLLEAFRGQIRVQSGIYLVEAAPSLLQHFHDLTSGITVTCPGFYGPQGRILRGGLSHPDLVDQLGGFSFENRHILNFEMETAGLYGLGRVLNHECLSISTIVANRISHTFSKDGQAAVEAMIAHCLGIISGI